MPILYVDSSYINISTDQLQRSNISELKRPNPRFLKSYIEDITTLRNLIDVKYPENKMGGTIALAATLLLDLEEEEDPVVEVMVAFNDNDVQELYLGNGDPIVVKCPPFDRKLNPATGEFEVKIIDSIEAIKAVFGIQ